MLKSIGFLNFVRDYEEPFSFLKTALSESEIDVRDSLLVLPESFNYGRSLSRDQREAPKFPRAEAEHELKTLSHLYEVSFVVSLIEFRRNSAYLIHGNQTIFMGHKRKKDWSDTYDPFEGDSGENPIEHRGIRLGALICADAWSHGPALADKLDARSSARKIICIPAHMDAGYLEGPSLDSSHWHGKYVILANSKPWPEGTRSFVTNRSASKLGWPIEQRRKLFLRTWDDLDSL